MKSTTITEVLIIVSILGGLLFGGLSVGFTSTDRAGAQMMVPGMMQNGGFFNTFRSCLLLHLEDVSLLLTF